MFGDIKAKNARHSASDAGTNQPRPWIGETMRTWLRKLVGITGHPRPTNLEAAIIQIANSIRPDDSFCVKELFWRHKSVLDSRSFMVSLFVGDELPVQVEGKVLNEVVDTALGEYEKITGILQ